jgi:hypothetical protein
MKALRRGWVTRRYPASVRSSTEGSVLITFELGPEHSYHAQLPIPGQLRKSWCRPGYGLWWHEVSLNGKPKYGFFRRRGGPLGYTKDEARLILLMHDLTPEKLGRKTGRKSANELIRLARRRHEQATHQ